MLRKDVEEEQLSQSGGIDSVMCGDEYALLRQVIHNNEDGGESGRRRKMFNEIHCNGVPQTFRDRELF